MACEGVPALLEALFIHNKADIMLDKRTKANLRRCSKHFKNLVDATVTAAEKHSDTLSDDMNVLLNTEWHGLRILHIWETHPNPNRLTELPSALFVKFSRLETLKIDYFTALKTLPEEIGALSHLKSLQLRSCVSIVGLPSSLGQLTALEEISLNCCMSMTAEGLAPLQHLTSLTFLKLAYCYKLRNYPDFICTLNALKALHLYSDSIETLPTALGNLTNLETLRIEVWHLERLPQSIGNLHWLKSLRIGSCNLTTLPESLDDLLWRKAQETEESKKMELVDFSYSRKLVFSTTMKQALELLKQNGTDIRWP